jgi:hypothetical protein
MTPKDESNPPRSTQLLAPLVELRTKTPALIELGQRCSRSRGVVLTLTAVTSKETAMGSGRRQRTGQGGRSRLKAFIAVMGGKRRRLKGRFRQDCGQPRKDCSAPTPVVAGRNADLPEMARSGPCRRPRWSQTDPRRKCQAGETAGAFDEKAKVLPGNGSNGLGAGEPPCVMIPPAPPSSSCCAAGVGRFSA